MTARGTLIPDDPQEDRDPKHDHQEDQVVHSLTRLGAGMCCVR
jgi:hypothetical protein